MFSFLSKKLQKNFIDCFSPIPLSACHIKKPYLLERAGIKDRGTVIMLAVPYYTPFCNDGKRNLSAYAVSEDYHLFFEQLFTDLLPDLRKEFPDHLFVGFADHSPIDEITAAARAGLGVIGKNHLLITPKYSSYVFLGEIITDALIDCEIHEISYCQNCGACRRGCPMEIGGVCLSALTQKKGALKSEETALLEKHSLVWGCDICQEVCPHTKRAMQTGSIFSPIPFFQKNALPYLTVEHLDAMLDETFSGRAYAWRGRETVRRNLLLHEKHAKKGDSPC